MKDNIKKGQKEKREIRDISNRGDLIELLEDIKAVEINARDSYEKDVLTFKNFIITDTIQKIKNDEDKHIEIIQNLIDMLKSKA